MLNYCEYVSSISEVNFDNKLVEKVNAVNYKSNNIFPGVSVALVEIRKG